MPNQKYFISIAKNSLVALACLLSIQPVFADQFDTLNYMASGGINYDDNVFRLPPSFDPQIYLGKSSKSDLTRFLSIGLNVDKKYLNQELVLSANGTNFKYNNFSNLDYTSSTIKGAWYWQVSSKLRGGLNATRTQTLNNPADTRVYSRNLNTNNNLSLNGDGWVSGDFHLLFGLSSNRVSNSSNTVNYLASHSRVNELGAKYQPVEGRYIALLTRTIQQTTDGVVQTNTSFNEKQLELKANLQMTGKSALSANLMNINHRYDYYAQQNYSGNQGSIDYLLDISGKTSLNVSLKRTVNSWWDVASSHYVADSVSITPKWQMSSQAVMQATVSQGTNDYRGAAVSNAVTRKDEVQSVSLGVDWMPQRAVVVSASLQHSSRASSPAAYSRFEFNDNIFSVSAQVNF